MVLVVGGEATARRSLAEELCSSGFLITEVASAGSAMRDGLELIRHARRRWPTIALLVASTKPLEQLGPLPVGCRYLRKPCHSEAVITVIRELLAA